MTSKPINSLFFNSSIMILIMFMLIITSIFFVQDPEINKEFSIKNQEYSIIKEVLAKPEPKLNQSIQNKVTETFKSEYFGIQFEYPSTANLIENPLMTMSYSQLGSIFFEGIYNLPYLAINFYPLSLNEQTLDNFTSRFIKEKQDPGLFNSSISILNSRAIEFAGSPAHELEYIEQLQVDSQKKSSSQIESKIFSIWTINDNQAYELKYVGSKENYDRYLPEAKIIINSFKINK
ncbi:MAG: hypothetical protein ACE5SW_09825 [Nitrososphaeraceae archaeon]